MDILTDIICRLVIHFTEPLVFLPNLMVGIIAGITVCLCLSVLEEISSLKLVVEASYLC